MTEPEADAGTWPVSAGATAAGSSSGAVAWDTAERVAGWVGSRSHLPAPYRPDLLQADFEELTAQAEELVAASTGLRSSSGPARARVTDRAGWVHANVASFQRLVGPHLDKLDPARMVATNKVTERLAGPLASAGRVATGTQMGLVLGWLSTRVLGQYDLLLTEDAIEDQDLVYFVGPNVVALEQLHGFDPRQFRLWLALHEVTHRCQFTAIPWMRDYFVSLVEEGIGSLEPDPSRFAEALRRMTEEIRAGRNPLRDNGALGLVATPEQLEGLHRIQALMSLLEGHGDVTMDRAGAAAIPSAATVLRGAPPAAQADPGSRPPAPAAHRHRGQAPPVRGGGAVHRRRRGLRRSRAPRPGLAGTGVAALAGRDPQSVGMDLACRCHPRTVQLTPPAPRPPRRPRPTPSMR